MNKKISGRRWALAAVFVIGMLAFTGMAFAEGEDAPIHYGVLSLVVPLIAIVLSFITRQVILSLATAVFVGSVILNGGNVFHGFLRYLECNLNAVHPFGRRTDCGYGTHGRYAGDGAGYGKKSKKHKTRFDCNLDYGYYHIL